MNAMIQKMTFSSLYIDCLRQNVRKLKQLSTMIRIQHYKIIKSETRSYLKKSFKKVSILPLFFFNLKFDPK